MHCHRWLDRQVPCHQHALSHIFEVLVGKGLGAANKSLTRTCTTSVDLVNYVSSFCPLKIGLHLMLKDGMYVSCSQQVVVVEPVPSSQGLLLINQHDYVDSVISTLIAYYSIANHRNKEDVDYNQPKTFRAMTNLAVKFFSTAIHRKLGNNSVSVFLPISLCSQKSLV